MKVHVKAIEESPYFYTTRSVDLQLRDKTVSTPIRALTNGDLNAKARVPSDVSLSADVACSSMELSEENVTSLMAVNTSSERRIKSLENNSQRMQHSSIMIQSIQPSRNAVLEALPNDNLREKFLRILFRMQEEAGLEYVSVPWVGYSTHKAVHEMKRIARLSAKEPIFFLDLATDADSTKELIAPIREMADTGAIHFVGLLYRPVRSALATYDTLWETLKNIDLVTVLTNVPRYSSDMENLSAAHFNEFVLGDILVPKPPRPFFKSEKSPVRDVRIDHRLRIFDRRELTVNPVERIPTGNWIKDITSEIQDKAVRVALENYREADRDDEKGSVLTSISKVHEFIVSGKEFDLSKSRIIKGEVHDYIKSKKTLSRHLRDSKSQSRIPA